MVQEGDKENVKESETGRKKLILGTGNYGGNIRCYDDYCNCIPA